MKIQDTQLQEIFNELCGLKTIDKIKFFQTLLYQFTLAGRSIWSDNLYTDTEKVAAFMWMNELLHRIWNLHFDLQHDEDLDSITPLFEHFKFYGDHSQLLNMQLRPTIFEAFNNFKSK